MNPKIFFAAALIFLSFSFSNNDSFRKRDNPSGTDQLAQIQSLDQTYVKVFEDGTWWMYVYDSGVLVDRYPLFE